MLIGAALIALAYVCMFNVRARTIELRFLAPVSTLVALLCAGLTCAALAPATAARAGGGSRRRRSRRA